VPGTPAEEVVGVIQLSSSKDLDGSSFVFSGGHFEGPQQWDAATQSLVDVPEDGVPDAAFARWLPTLDPDAQYCATMTIYGRNDQAMPAPNSNQVCARVRNVEATGGNSGCSFQGRPARSGWALVLLGLLLACRRRAGG
jgi:hypothetical protein